MRAAQAAPGPGAGDGAHRLEHLPRKNNKKCVVCNIPGKGKGRSDYWCPACSAGVHEQCFYQLEHYLRAQRGAKRQLVQLESDSD